MNYVFTSCLFAKNNIQNQYNSISLSQNRVPFSDITQQMNTFFNSKKNQQNNILPNIFNDFSNTKKNTTFLKKKSHGEIINNIEDDEEKENHKQEHNKSRKYSNYCYDFQNPLINDLDEEKEENMEEYENYFENNNHKKGRKDENISFKQILDDAIQEKKELDLKERDKKKANKLKQLKMLKHKKNSSDYSNKNDAGEAQILVDRRGAQPRDEYTGRGIFAGTDVSEEVDLREGSVRVPTALLRENEGRNVCDRVGELCAERGGRGADPRGGSRGDSGFLKGWRAVAQGTLRTEEGQFLHL